MIRRTLIFALSLFLLSVGVANASWYDDYDAGLKAARAGNWQAVVKSMTAAISDNGTEDNKARSYGMNFVNYHPYYYRAIANLHLGRYQQAIKDLEKTTGPGPLNLGTIDTLMDRAKRELADAREAERQTAPAEPVRSAAAQPAAPQPAVPQIDPALRQRATAAIGTARQKLESAQQRGGERSQQYSQAMSIMTEAATKNASAKTNDDLNSIISLAENAGLLADLARPPAPQPTAAAAIPITPVTPKPAAATSTVMSDYGAEVRQALEYYFAGEFEEATQRFEQLSRKMPNNAWIWAFLGASQYSQYAFEADEMYRRAAERSFQRAKQLRSWNGGLPPKYFSRRIRSAFSEPAS